MGLSAPLEPPRFMSALPSFSSASMIACSVVPLSMSYNPSACEGSLRVAVGERLTPVSLSDLIRYPFVSQMGLCNESNAISDAVNYGRVNSRKGT